MLPSEPEQLTKPSTEVQFEHLIPKNKPVHYKKAFDKVTFPKKDSFSHLLPKEAHTTPLPSQTSEPQWSQLEVLGQCNLTYIITQSRESLILIDQHAAHERVAFEKLMDAWNKKHFKVQKNLIPQTIKMEPHLCDHLLKHNFNEMGIEIERMGPDMLIISSKPDILSDKGLTQALISTAKQIEELGDSFSLHKIVGDLFATMACHSVIRAGQALSLEEMKSLLEQMDQFKLSSFCPHGRPVFTEFPFSKLDKEFGRV